MIINKPYLKDIANEKSLFKSITQGQVILENSNIRSSKDIYDLFLSHSYLDKDLVYALVSIFNKAQYSVYVDWMVDTQLDRSHVNKATAQTLRERMDSSRGLAYVSTSNITNSKWCPWELGYVDGNKRGRCAILPVLETRETSFRGQEYLGVYPYIDYETLGSRDRYDFWVNDPNENNKYVILSEWLKGKEPYYHK